MSTFKHYAQYYDLFYGDKNYAAEADYVNQRIKQHHPKTKTILEFGCGTGKHATQLAQHGYAIHGIDLSPEMVHQAQHIHEGSPNLSFSHADLRTVSLKKTFDTVVSLFHVMSYQTTNDDLTQAFVSAYKHLEPGGLFIFDCWYGPAVLTQLPTIRVKRIEHNDLHITRISEPQLHHDTNCVDVCFTIFIQQKNFNIAETIQETHRMRYLFVPEIQDLFMRTGFVFKTVHAWLTDTAPDVSNWNICFVGQKL